MEDKASGWHRTAMPKGNGLIITTAFSISRALVQSYRIGGKTSYESDHQFSDQQNLRMPTSYNVGRHHTTHVKVLCKLQHLSGL